MWRTNSFLLHSGRIWLENRESIPKHCFEWVTNFGLQFPRVFLFTRNVIKVSMKKCLHRAPDEEPRCHRFRAGSASGLIARIGCSLVALVEFNAPLIATNLIYGVWQVGSCCNAIRGWTMHWYRFAGCRCQRGGLFPRIPPKIIVRFQFSMRRKIPSFGLLQGKWVYLPCDKLSSIPFSCAESAVCCDEPRQAPRISVFKI